MKAKCQAYAVPFRQPNLRHWFVERIGVPQRHGHCICRRGYILLLKNGPIHSRIKPRLLYTRPFELPLPTPTEIAEPSYPCFVECLSSLMHLKCTEYKGKTASMGLSL